MGSFTRWSFFPCETYCYIECYISLIELYRVLKFKQLLDKVVHPFCDFFELISSIFLGNSSVSFDNTNSRGQSTGILWKTNAQGWSSIPLAVNKKRMKKGARKCVHPQESGSVVKQPCQLFLFFIFLFSSSSRFFLILQ